MAFRFDVSVNLAKHSHRIDHKTGSIPVHRAFVLALAGARVVEEASVCVREQINRESELVAEVLV